MITSAIKEELKLREPENFSERTWLRELNQWYLGLSKEEQERIQKNPITPEEEVIHALFWASVNDSIDNRRMAERKDDSDYIEEGV